MAEADGQGGRLPTQILAEEKVRWRCAKLLLLVYTRQLEFSSNTQGSSAYAQLKYAGMVEADGQGGHLPTRNLAK